MLHNGVKGLPKFTPKPYIYMFVDNGTVYGTLGYIYIYNQKFETEYGMF